MGNYCLKHRDISVAELELDPASGAILSIGAIYEAAHVPVGIPVKKGMIDRRALNNWWRGRAIPASRSGIQNVLQELDIADTQLLLEKCLGLSLSDQYWICPAGSGLSWKQVNFFEHAFSEDVGNLLFGQKRSDVISLMSPDNTSDGWLKKKWTIIEGKRCLVKGGSGATWQEPYNEVLASRMMERLQIPHVSYTLLIKDGYPYSVCEDFITPETELIPAWYVLQTKKKSNQVSLYRHYLDCCSELGVPGVEQAINQMLVLDYLIQNEDRHQNNFGVVRRADTLEYIGAAPIYDSGTSLWFDKPTALIGANTKITSKPFRSSQEEQIRLVTDTSWLELSALDGIEEELREIVRDSLFIEEARCEALCRGIRQRIKQLEQILPELSKDSL